MQTVTTPTFVHIVKPRERHGHRETLCGRVRTEGNDHVMYPEDPEPKTPTCLWCAGERAYS